MRGPNAVFANHLPRDLIDGTLLQLLIRYSRAKSSNYRKSSVRRESDFSFNENFSQATVDCLAMMAEDRHVRQLH